MNRCSLRFPDNDLWDGVRRHKRRRMLKKALWFAASLALALVLSRCTGGFGTDG